MAQRNEKEIAEAQKIYATTRQDLLTRNLSNTERYDNAILTLSTAMLGISLAFIKDIVHLDQAQYIFLLNLSWIALGSCVVSTISSFLISQVAIKRQLEYAEKYYLDGDEEYLNRKNIYASWTDNVNYISGGLFLLGILTISIFIALNTAGGKNMSKEYKKSTTGGANIPRLQKVQHESLREGAQIPSMQPTSKPSAIPQSSSAQVVSSGEGERGASIPPLQPVKTPTAKPQDAGSGGGSGKTDN